MTVSARNEGNQHQGGKRNNARVPPATTHTWAIRAQVSQVNARCDARDLHAERLRVPTRPPPSLPVQSWRDCLGTAPRRARPRAVTRSLPWLTRPTACLYAARDVSASAEHHMHHHEDHHASASAVLRAAMLTTIAAALEAWGAWRSGSLFLGADAVHLLAHLGIFGILVLPTTQARKVREDSVVVGLLAIVALVGLGIVTEATGRLSANADTAPPAASLLLSGLGLGANLATAYLFRPLARARWSFRAALAHEIADGSVTVAAFVGAVGIALYGWRWVDPLLTLGVGVSLLLWSSRLLVRRAQVGPSIWTLQKG